jgi:hypothetical protein
MSKFTEEDLLKKLDRDLSWRKKELSLLKSNINQAVGSLLETNIRTGIALLYAHWEGFIKIASRNYLKYLNHLQLNCGCLKNNFKILALKTTIFDTSKATNFESHSRIVNEILYNIDNRIFKVNIKDQLIIDTKSNLSFDVFKELLMSLGIGVNDFELKKPFIEDRLVKVRHRIVHGEYVSFVSGTSVSDKVIQDIKDEFNEVYFEILSLMNNYKEKILDSVMNKSYLKSS